MPHFEPHVPEGIGKSQPLSRKLLRIKSQRCEQPVGQGAKALEQALGTFSLTMIGVGATIGTGIFFTMAIAVPKAGPSVILSFLIAAMTAGLTALCYAELSFRVPASGSDLLGFFEPFIPIKRLRLGWVDVAA